MHTVTIPSVDVSEHDYLVVVGGLGDINVDRDGAVLFLWAFSVSCVRERCIVLITGNFVRRNKILQFEVFYGGK